MRKVGIFGGTFNPIHKGHIKIAQSFYHSLALDEIVLVPSAAPVHKASRGLAPSEDRLAMCRLAVKNLRGFSVSDYEITSGQKSYTVYTLRKFHEIYEDAELYLIIGSDMLFTLDGWYSYEEILKTSVICAAAREQSAQDKLSEYAKRYEKMGARVEILPMKPIEISSREIRAMLARGEDVAPYLEPTVCDYIKRKGLYQSE